MARVAHEKQSCDSLLPGVMLINPLEEYAALGDLGGRQFCRCDQKDCQQRQ